MNIKYILGILVIVALIVLLFMFAPPRTAEGENKSVEQLAYKLFEYGNAAVAYAKDNPKGFEPENERLAFYGYAWLQPDYLPEDYNLELSGFSFVPVGDSQSPVKTILNVREAGLGHHHLEVELIEFGELQFEGKMDLQTAHIAVRLANNLRAGGRNSLIHYRVAMGEKEDGKQHVHIVGEDSRLSRARASEQGESVTVPMITDTYRAPAVTKSE